VRVYGLMEFRSVRLLFPSLVFYDSMTLCILVSNIAGPLEGPKGPFMVHSTSFRVIQRPFSVQFRVIHGHGPFRFHSGSIQGHLRSIHEPLGQ
jgi:hypothetical protein